MRIVWKTSRIAAFLLPLVLIVAWSPAASTIAGGMPISPLSSILQRGVLTVALEEKSPSYFLYKGRPVGYQFELLSAYARELGVELAVVSVETAEDGANAVRTGKVDMYAPLDWAGGPLASLAASEAYDTTQVQHPLAPRSRSMPLAVYMQNAYPDLLVRTNIWIAKYRQSRRAVHLDRKYGANGYMRGLCAESPRVRISPYDQLIRKATRKTQWDWRLVAALIYQESRFLPAVESRKGAYGLMQFTPSAASFFGISHRAAPNQQISAGVRYLEWLDAQFAKRGIPEANRKAFVLAAYNAGLGRVERARKLAEKEGKSPDVWAGNVALYCSKSLKQGMGSQKQSYGIGETCNYVYDILNRYAHYKNILEA